jgi:hypothetical protein
MRRTVLETLDVSVRGQPDEAGRLARELPEALARAMRDPAAPGASLADQVARQVAEALRRTGREP